MWRRRASGWSSPGPLPPSNPPPASPTTATPGIRPSISRRTARAGCSSSTIRTRVMVSSGIAWDLTALSRPRGNRDDGEMAPLEPSGGEDRVAPVEGREPIAHDLEPQAARRPERGVGIEGVLDHDPQAVGRAPRFQADFSSLPAPPDPVHDPRLADW